MSNFFYCRHVFKKLSAEEAYLYGGKGYAEVKTLCEKEELVVLQHIGCISGKGLSFSQSHKINLQQMTQKSSREKHGKYFYMKVQLSNTVENIVAKGEIPHLEH